MWTFIIFIRDGLVKLTSMLDSVSFSIGSTSYSFSLLDIMIGFIAMGIVISVFWKGARSS